MCRSPNNQGHRLLTIIREWKWQLGMKAAVSRSGRCRPAAAAAAGGASAGRQQQMSALMEQEVAAPFPCRHQNTEKTRHSPSQGGRAVLDRSSHPRRRADVDVDERSRKNFLLR